MLAKSLQAIIPANITNSISGFNPKDAIIASLNAVIALTQRVQLKFCVAGINTLKPFVFNGIISMLCCNLHNLCCIKICRQRLQHSMFKGFQDKGFSGIKACFFRTKRTFWVNPKSTIEIPSIRHTIVRQFYRALVRQERAIQDSKIANELSHCSANKGVSGLRLFGYLCLLF